MIIGLTHFERPINLPLTSGRASYSPRYIRRSCQLIGITHFPNGQLFWDGVYLFRPSLLYPFLRLFISLELDMEVGSGQETEAEEHLRQAADTEPAVAQIQAKKHLQPLATKCNEINSIWTKNPIGFARARPSWLNSKAGRAV